jgi:hypothetical protein
VGEATPPAAALPVVATAPAAAEASLPAFDPAAILGAVTTPLLEAAQSAVTPLLEAAFAAAVVGLTGVPTGGNLLDTPASDSGLKGAADSESGADTSAQVPAMGEDPLSLGDPEAEGTEVPAPRGSGVLARVGRFDPTVFQLAVQQIVEQVSELGEELLDPLEGQRLFSAERPRLMAWLMAAAVAASAYEMARRQMQVPVGGEGAAGHGHGPAAMWFPDSHDL